ncbi:MAG: fasciclin domain-containing protein [Bacteroidota bacterium]
MLKNFYTLLFVFFAVFSHAQTQTVMEIIEDSPVHTTLENAINLAGLNTTLSDPNANFTVFAPTDDAFSGVDQTFLNTLLADPTGDLQRILLYHVLGSEVFSNQLADGQMAPTLLGQDITVTINNMMEVFINSTAQVTGPDNDATNGVVHIMNGVILPPASTVVDVIVNSPNHNTLETAVLASQLDTVLTGAGPFTVFAPTDAAFMNMDQDLLNALLADPSDSLAKALFYHVAAGEILSPTLMDGQTATTALGQGIQVTVDMNGVFINNAQVTVADIRTYNGVVHVLDAVILPPALNVAEVIINSPVHTTLETAVGLAGLVDVLDDEGPFTVFAPTDDAFMNMDQNLLNALLADPTDSLAKALLYHVAAGEILSPTLMDGQSATTALGQGVTVTVDMNGVFINNAQVSIADIRTFNGVVHVLDAVILPPALNVAEVIINSPVHTTLETAVGLAGLVDVLDDEGPFTVFAPTDDAFMNMDQDLLNALLADPTDSLAKALLYHVASGEVLSPTLTNGQSITTFLGQGVEVTIDANGVFINNAQVSIADIVTFNGVVHVIDAVILPPALNVAEVIINSPVHTTLETAVGLAGLVDVLDDEGPFTVFAPTDDAFMNMDQDLLNALLADPMDSLAKALLYHVTAGEILSATLTNGQTATTLLGQGIEVTIDANGVFINNAQVTIADIVTFNGVVHVIDAVILPPALNVVDVIVNSPDHTTLETVVVDAGLDGVLSGEGPFTVFAPTDAAFMNMDQNLLSALQADPTDSLVTALLYHAVSGEVLSSTLTDGQAAGTLLGQNIDVTIDANGVFTNNAQVTVTDIRTFNGVVHVIDAVMLPPALNIVDVVVNSPVHGTLEMAVLDAQLEGTLSEEGKFTLFAPTDAAFGNVDPTLLTSLMADPGGDLTKVLQYHVLTSEVLSSDLTDGQVATTFLGQDITVGVGANVTINNATVTTADIRTFNGVVHVINEVLLPDLTSVRDLDQVSLNAYPNPTIDLITVDVPQEMLDKEVMVQLVNINGQTVKTWNFNDVTETINSLSNISCGTSTVIKSIVGFG